MQYYNYDEDAIFIPYGVEVRHTWHEIGIIFHVIQSYRVDFVIEIGTYKGGMTMMLHSKYVANPYFNYMTVEIDPDVIDPAIRNLIEPHLMIADCLLPETMESIVARRELICPSGRTLVYCDNGKKARVFNMYKDILKHGDIIMTHDYWDGRSRVYGLPEMGIKGVLLPEVKPEDLEGFSDGYFPMSEETLAGTRIKGFIKL